MSSLLAWVLTAIAPVGGWGALAPQGGTGVREVTGLETLSERFDTARYEIGRRLRRFERAWERADAAARERALPAVLAAVMGFFRGDVDAAAGGLDVARRAITGDDAVRAWTDSLALLPERRLLDASRGRLALELAPLYEPSDVELRMPLPYELIDVGRPQETSRLSLELVDPRAAAGTIVSSQLELGTLPLELALPLPQHGEGDLLLRARLSVGERPVDEIELTLSLVQDLEARLAALGAAARDGGLAPTLEAESLRGLLELLEPLARGVAAETDLPAARLLAEAEALAACAARGKRWLDATRAGEHWLCVPLGPQRVPLRVHVPAGLDEEDPRPLVVALHGLGGSENLFFDGYGDGLAAQLSAERGWILVAPRPLRPPVPALIDALSVRLPIDRARVALIGHSMGAVHALELAGQGPQQYAAAVLLSAGGSPAPSEPLRQLPFWLGAGEHDFSLPGTRRLAAALLEAGVERVELHVLPHAEHLTTVQASLREAFGFLDGQLAPR